MATRESQGWVRPRLNTSNISNEEDKADAEEWSAQLEALPLFGRLLSSHGNAIQAWVYEKKTVEGTYVCFWQMEKPRSCL